MESDNPSYYSIIPANVRYDKELTPNAKLLYGEITSLCNKKGHCWATNKYFSELYDVSQTSISKWINQLVSKGYLVSKIVYKDGTKEILNRHLSLVTYPIEEKLHTPIQEKLIVNNTSINNKFNNKDIKEEEFENLRQSEFFKKLTDYFSQNTERLERGVFSFIVARINNGEFEEFKSQTLAYIEYKSLSKETVHRWAGYSAEWKQENWIDKLSKIKTPEPKKWKVL